MLTADQFDTLTDPIVALYNEYETSIIVDIARRLGNMDFTSAAWQVQRLTESGALYKDVLSKLAKQTGKSEATLREIFKKAGVKAIAFDDKIYKAAGLNPIPLNLSPAMLKALTAGLSKTNGILSNLTMTTAISAQQSFIKAADMAYLQVSTGAMSYDQAIRMAVKKMASEGLSVINYASGHKDKIDVATRRTVLTGVGQTAAELQIIRADEMGQDLIEVSAHIGARNVGTGPENHELWQGKVYSRSGSTTEYPPFVESTGYGTGEGLAGWNCRHSFFPFFEGISERANSNDTLKEYANEKVTYNGKEISVYEGTQYQRGIERKIRNWKRQADALKAAGQDNTFELSKVKDYQAQMRDFIKQTGLDRQRVRESVIGSGGAISPIPSPAVMPITPVQPIAPVVETPQINAVGTPVSNALDLSALKNAEVKNQVNIALSAVDKVHGDGQLKKIPVINSTAKRYYGMFRAWGRLDGAHNISIAAIGDHKALTFIHETGHFIDHGGFGRLWGASGYDGFAKDLMLALRKSDWFSNLYQRAESLAQAVADGVFRFDRKYINYLASSKELFARAYAQFIAIESGDPILLAQLKKLQDAKFPTQWSDEDFKPIAEEFRKLFRQQGWMK